MTDYEQYEHWCQIAEAETNPWRKHQAMEVATQYLMLANMVAARGDG